MAYKRSWQWLRLQNSQLGTTARFIGLSQAPCDCVYGGAIRLSMASELQITLAKATRLEHLPFVRGSAKQTDLSAFRVGGINYPIIFPKCGHH